MSDDIELLHYVPWRLVPCLGSRLVACLVRMFNADMRHVLILFKLVEILVAVFLALKKKNCLGHEVPKKSKFRVLRNTLATSIRIRV